jgi:dienelactone hydrolase
MAINFDAAPPRGAESLAVPWITVPVSNIGILPCAVIRPSGQGPFPTVVLLHGSHGFAHEYVRLASDLARSGFLTLAPGWFREGSGPGVRFITPIICPDAPPRPDPLSSEVVHLVDALVQAVRALPDALGNHLALFGHSRGGGAVLNYVTRTGGIQAAILSSSRYPRSLRPLCRGISTPLLMLHGTDDRLEDGGTEFTTIEMARAFERELHSHAKAVEAVYYPGGRHNDIFADQHRYADEVSHMRAFLKLHLRSS